MKDQENQPVRVQIPVSVYTENERQLRYGLIRHHGGGEVHLRARFEDLFHDISTVCEVHNLQGPLAAVVLEGSKSAIRDQVLTLVVYKYEWESEKLALLRGFCKPLKIAVYVVDKQQQHFSPSYFEQLVAENEADTGLSLANSLLLDFHCPKYKSPLIVRHVLHKRSVEAFGVILCCSRFGSRVRKCEFIAPMEDVWSYLDEAKINTRNYIVQRAKDMLAHYEGENLD